MNMKSEKFNLCGRNYYSPTLVVEYVLTESGFAHRTAVLMGLTEPKS